MTTTTIDHDTPILGRWRTGAVRTVKRVRGNGQGFERIYYGCLIEVILEIGPSMDSDAVDEIRGHVILMPEGPDGIAWHEWANSDGEWVSPGLLRWLRLGVPAAPGLRAALDELEETIRPIAQAWAAERDARRGER